MAAPIPYRATKNVRARMPKPKSGTMNFSFAARTGLPGSPVVMHCVQTNISLADLVGDCFFVLRRAFQKHLGSCKHTVRTQRAGHDGLRVVLEQVWLYAFVND